MGCMSITGLTLALNMLAPLCKPGYLSSPRTRQLQLHVRTISNRVGHFCLDTGFIIFFQVDTHVHAASGMNQKHLLRFIKRKMKYNADDIVMIHEGKEVTLREVITATNLVIFLVSFIMHLSSASQF